MFLHLINKGRDEKNYIEHQLITNTIENNNESEDTPTMKVHIKNEYNHIKERYLIDS